ncbi:response regulator [Pseudomonas tritici]|uniref:response regulator n=1 Tax=Pseudomonas tritici TaxID=2745518 RepID=UPI00387B919E
MINPVKMAHLSWLRAPIQKYIERCKLAMVNITTLRDRINTPPGGAEAVWFVNQREKLETNQVELSNLLGYIASALSVVDSYGGYVFANEIRTLASVARLSLGADDQDKALLAIQSSLTVLPSYLGMIVAGAHDSPGVLLKHINDMRAIREAPALSDDSALPVNLAFSYVSPPRHERDCDLSDRERVFKKAATQFCILYTQAMKDSGESAWEEMRDHLRELQRVTNDPELGCYWWVGEAIIDVIIADKFYMPPSMTTALRVVMIATQRLPQGEDAAKQALNPSKFSSLLNALSISRKQTSTAAAVITHFDVKQNVEEGRIQQLQEQLVAQSVKEISDVVPEIKPRLESAMISFGRAVNSKHPEGFVVQTQAFDQAMRTIANIFGVFNETELSDMSFYLADAVKSVSSVSDFTPEVIETVKTQILFLDSKLIHMNRNEAARHLQIENVTSDVIDCIFNETASRLTKVSRMIATHVDSGGVGSDKLLDALESLRELASVYEFANSLTIGNILSAIVTVISDEVKGGVLIESPRLTLAARAIVAIEMYIGYIASKLQPPTTLIEMASEAVREMGINVSEIRIVSHSDLLAKFESSGVEEDGLDALMREIFDCRQQIEDMHKDTLNKPAVISRYATACLRLSASSMIQGEKKFAELCRHSAELANTAPGRLDDPSFDYKAAMAVIKHSSETILRCMDDYSTKGKVNLFLVDAIKEVSAIIGHTVAVTEPVAISEPEPEQPKPEKPYPPNYDPHLLELFAEEFVEQLTILQAYTAGDDLTVTESVCRAIHNIHGCSGSASCVAINTLFDVLESRFYALLATEDSLTANQAKQLSQLLISAAEYQKAFPWEASTDVLPEWLLDAGNLTGSKMSSAPADVYRPPAPHHSVIEPEAVNPLAPSQQFVQTAPTALPEPVVEPTQIAKVIEVAMADEVDYNLDDIELYICDADDVIPELQSNIQEWMGNMADRELTLSIRRNMHTLKGAAGIINATGIRSLTHHMESLFDSMSSGAVIADAACADLARFVLNELVTMSDAVRGGRAYRTLPALNDLVSKACEVSYVDAGELADVIHTSYGLAQTATAAPAPQTIIDEAIAVKAEAPTQAPAVEAAEQTQPHQHPTTSVAEPEQQVAETASLESRAVTPEPEHLAATSAEQDDPQGARHNFRGYRGKRDRANGERQRHFDEKQTRKLPVANVVAFEPILPVGEPEYTDIVTQQTEISSQVLNLIQRASESDKDAKRTSKKNSKGSEKIKVELQLLDNSVKLSNELKASSHRQNSLHRQMLLSCVALREKMGLHLMHSNKTTVHLRHFNNITSHGSNRDDTSGSDEQRLYLERFNHLSHAQTQAVLQIEQMIQDIQDMLTQSNLLDNGFKYQTDVIASLQRDLLQSRLVMFDNEKPSINGAFTGALQLSGKKADLQVLGTDTRIDRQLLESIRDPIRHVVTNAVAHGIESEAERLTAGKPAAGKIVVKATRRAKTLVIEVTDDGRGIDLEAIRAKAITQGIIKAEDKLSDQETLHLITESGFSTANSISELSGRGVGMDIVRNKISSLGGNLRITTALGKGSTIELELPLTIGSNRALVCKISDQWFAIPTFNMTQVLDYPTNDLLALKAKPGQAAIEFDDKTYDVVHLADLMAIPDLKLNSVQIPSHTSLVLVEQGDARLAIEVERGISMPEIHVTKFDGILSNVKGIIGSTEVHDGTPALVLDVIELARLNLRLTDNGYTPKLYRVRRVKRDARPLVLIVDDASSYQKILTRHFKALGWEVASAHNGQDALDKLPTLSAPSLFVVDVEMPRMNGLDLTEKLRAIRQFDNTPIIMMTTRSGVKESALKLGVDVFLSKPYDGPVLNEAIRTVCPDVSAAGIV